MTQPDSIEVELDLQQPNCNTPDEGYIFVNNINGGGDQFELEVNGAIQSGFDFGPAGPGLYRIRITDENGCESYQTVTLEEPKYPVIDAGSDLEVSLGDSVKLNARIFSMVQSILWLNDSTLSCSNCLDPYARPLTDETYFIKVEDDNGCISIDSVFVRVKINTDVFVPSAFSPNADGVNDGFTLFAGPNVTNIKSLKIFSRWGETLFENMISSQMTLN
ncbi:MAG: gliding motility-associated C-terminal domain-containing protein [Saprospiraceae bacterium]